MSQIISKKLKNNKILLVEVIRNKKEVFKKKLYKNSKNVVGVDIKQKKIKSIKLVNTGDNKFCSNIIKLVS